MVVAINKSTQRVSGGRGLISRCSDYHNAAVEGAAPRPNFFAIIIVMSACAVCQVALGLTGTTTAGFRGSVNLTRAAAGSTCEDDYSKGPGANGCASGLMEFKISNLRFEIERGDEMRRVKKRRAPAWRVRALAEYYAWAESVLEAWGDRTDHPAVAAFKHSNGYSKRRHLIDGLPASVADAVLTAENAENAEKG